MNVTKRDSLGGARTRPARSPNKKIFSEFSEGSKRIFQHSTRDIFRVYFSFSHDDIICHNYGVVWLIGKF